jgi:hypothetical protein
MGNTTLLDILGSTIIGGILFLTALRLNANAVENSTAYYANYLLQSNLVNLIVLLEDDFKRIGYCKIASNIPEPAKAIITADSSTFAFLTDNSNVGKVDTIQYSIGPTSELAATPNPRDRYLYRKLNNKAPDKWNLGVTVFNFKYYSYDTEIPLPYGTFQPSQAGLIDLSVQLESPAPMKQDYMQDTSQYQVFWRQIRLSSKNLRYR